MSDDPLVSEFQDLIERLGREVSDEVVSKATDRMIAALKASVDNHERKVQRAEDAADAATAHVADMRGAARDAKDAAGRAERSSHSLARSIKTATDFLQTVTDSLQSTTDASVRQLQATADNVEDGLHRKYDSLRRTVLVLAVTNVTLIGGALWWISTRP